MFRRRLPLAVAIATAAVLSGAPADATGPGTLDALAGEAARLVAEEQVLLRLDDARSTIAPNDRADLRDLLRAVDDRGVAILTQLDELDVELTADVRAALGPLPRSSDATTDPRAQPPASVYEAAIADLGRLAALPDTGARGKQGDRPLSLLLVGLAAAIVFTVTLATATSRWRPGQRDLEALAWTDGLTGVANRRRLDADLEAFRGARVSVAMIDADHFKTVNDRFGHQTGDAVLRRLAATLTQHVRLDDLVYRYGGEEFCVLLPHASVDDAQPILDGIVAAARQIVLPDGDHLTVSIGVADSDGRDDVLDAVDAADRALYDAKRRGRDRIAAAPRVDRHLLPA